METIESRMKELALLTIRQDTSSKQVSHLIEEHSELPREQLLQTFVNDILAHIKTCFDEDTTLQKLESKNPQSWHATAHLHYTTKAMDAAKKAFEALPPASSGAWYYSCNVM